jgi:hypothetical protein
MKPTGVYEDSINPGAKCRSCGALITWAVLVKTNVRHPFNGEPEILMRGGAIDRRAVVVVDLDTTHWATCPDAASWRTRKVGQQ